MVCKRGSRVSTFFGLLKCFKVISGTYTNDLEQNFLKVYLWVLNKRRLELNGFSDFLKISNMNQLIQSYFRKIIKILTGCSCSTIVDLFRHFLNLIIKECFRFLDDNKKCVLVIAGFIAHLKDELYFKITDIE